MKIGTRIALYLVLTLSLGTLTALSLAGWMTLDKFGDAEQRLRREIKYSLMIDQQDMLVGLANYAGGRLFNPLYRLDIDALNLEIAALQRWMPVKSFEIVDPQRRIVTDGSVDNPRFGQLGDDDHFVVFDLSTPHVYSLPQGYGMVFSIRSEGTVAGMAHVILSDIPFVGALTRVSEAVDEITGELSASFLGIGAGALMSTLFAGAVISWLLSRRLTRPLRQMTVAAREYEAGNLAYTIPILSGDEIGTLAESLNRMAQNLKRSNVLLAEAQSVARLGSWEFHPESGRFDWSSECYGIFESVPNAFQPTVETVGRRLAEESRPAFKACFDGLAGGDHQRPLEITVVGPRQRRRVVQMICQILRSGSTRKIIGTFQDVTEHREASAKMAQLANFDHLTGLPNRNLFKDRLGQAIRKADRSGRKVALLFIDLDRFKNINDTLGHGIGDELLRQTAERIQSCVRGEDTTARLGGDEFTVIAGEVEDTGDAGIVARNIIDAVSRPLMLEGHEVFTTPSIGIAIYPDDASDADLLIRNADTAMYQAKDRGRNGYQYFTAEMNVAAQERLSIETALRAAVARRELSLHYQPQMAIASGRITGFEALLRWDHDGVPVSPAKFVPILEDCGLIVEVGAWVLATACRWAADLRRTSGDNFVIAVNLSGRQFQAPGLLAAVRQALLSSGLPPEALELEITESIMVDMHHTLATMVELKAIGVSLALDDFGTGYSSLSYLKRFPIDRLKIDRGFVRDIAVDHDDAAIVRAIVAMAKGLGLSVVAEGVEEVEQLAFLGIQGCEEIQGYLLSKPRAGPDLVAGIETLRDAGRALAVDRPTATADAGRGHVHLVGRP